MSSGFDNTGEITVWSDFTGILNDVAWGTGTLVAPLAEGIGFTSDDEGSFASTVDEPGGILAITTDVGDNDSAVLFAGPFKASDGGMWTEARFKYSNVDVAVMFGFQETVSLTAPVMGLEYATTTMTYGNVGNVVGFNYDVDGTTDDWRAAAGDGQAAVAGSGNGTRANATVTADRWVTARVEVFPDGTAECYLSDVGHADTNGIPQMRLIKRFAGTNASNGTTGLNPDDLMYAILMVENRSANARVLEVDYFFGEGQRDWRCS